VQLSQPTMRLIRAPVVFVVGLIALFAGGTASAEPVARLQLASARGSETKDSVRLVQAPQQIPLVETAPDLPERSVRDVSIAINTPDGETPTDIAAKKFNQLPLVLEGPGWQRPWLASEFFWTAPAVGYQPLYFEDANLERYGHSFGVLQPAVSAGRGFGQFMALPYQMTLQPPREIVYPLGYARPGDRVMYQAERLEWDARAAAVEAGVLTGFIFLIP
jgi:hypothetical protein